jgi:hypothetical protein
MPEIKQSDIKVGICVFDLHFPYHNKELWQNILKVCRELKPDVFLFGGDNMDMDAVNHWEIDKGNKRFMEGKRLRKSYDDFQKEILDEVKKVIPDHCRKVYMYGNHSNFIERYIDKCPELEGFAEIERNLNLKDWEIIPYHQTVKVGKMYFHHGEYTGKHHASKMVDVFEKNIISGHSHDFQVHTKVTPVDGDVHMGMSMPCACDLNPLYMKDKSSAWVNGFGVFYILPNGNFNIYPIIASKGHFVFNGEYY